MAKAWRCESNESIQSNPFKISVSDCFILLPMTKNLIFEIRFSSLSRQRISLGKNNNLATVSVPTGIHP